MPPERLEAGYRRIVGGWSGPWHQPSRWHALNDPLEEEYTRRIVAVAQKHSVETIFVRLPFYKSPPNMYDEGFYRSLGPLLDAEGLTTDPHYYGDEGHFNRYGTNLVSPWLDQAIQPYLGPLKTFVTSSR